MADADASSGASAGLSRKVEREILRALASVGQSAVGKRIAKSETWVSRWKSEDLKSCAGLLAALGLKVVPADHKCYAPDYIEHLHYFAKRGMQDASPELVQDFDE
jgi:hypothetical protein